MTTAKVNWSSLDGQYWVEDIDHCILWFDSSLEAQAAARSIDLKRAALDEREAIVAWLRTEAQRCDCFAYEEGECACGAWGTELGERSYKTSSVEDLADAIARCAHYPTKVN